MDEEVVKISQNKSIVQNFGNYNKLKLMSQEINVWKERRMLGFVSSSTISYQAIFKSADGEDGGESSHDVETKPLRKRQQAQLEVTELKMLRFF